MAKLLDTNSLNGVFHEIKQAINDGKVTSAEVNYQEDGGSPTASVDFENGKLTFDMKNMKMKFSDLSNEEKEAIRGYQGRQGDSFQPIEDVSGLVLAHTTGTDNTKAMSQKGVTDAIGEYQGLTLTRLTKTRINDGAIEARDNQHCWWAPVISGDVINVIATDSSSGSAMRIAFSISKPATGVSVTGLVSLTGTSINQTISSEVNGYVIINHGASNYTDRSVQIMRYAKAGELSAKASTGSMKDLLKAVMNVTATEAVQETDVHENSLSINGYLAGRFNDNSYYKVYEFDVEEGKAYQVKGSVPPSDSYVGYLFVDVYGAMVSFGKQGGSTRTPFSELVVCPNGAVTLYVSAFESSASTEKGELFTFVNATTESQKAQVRKNLGIIDLGIRTNYPKMYYEAIGSSNGLRGSSFQNKGMLATLRFIKVQGDVTVKMPFDGNIRIFWYDASFQFLATRLEQNVEKDADVVIEKKENAEYVKFHVYKDKENENDDYFPDLPMLRIPVTGVFGDHWDYFNVDQYNSGRERTIVFVNVTDPKCCDDETNVVQDEGSLMYDFGKIYLPPTYTNTGAPTRMIIYCHGAGVNYKNTNIDSGEADDLIPDYWLKEGYAIMDIEGNPFNNDNEHNQTPQAMDCYVAAYKWAIECYNLCRDGVLLGGRSMGGSCAINLSRRECPIPVIATCSNVPGGLTMSNADREKKKYIADKCGFDYEEGFEWSNGALTTGEKDIILANWEKFAKNNPTLAMITNLPAKESVMANYTYNLFKGFSDANFLRAELKCPIKFFACEQDQKAPPSKCARMLYDMLIRGGQRTEIRVFDDPDFDYPSGKDAHHYETVNTNIRANVTTKYGDALTGVPVVYIEMLKFWRRYEQEI